MAQNLSPQENDQQALIKTLQTLSAREQIGILLGASRSLSGRDKAVVFRTAGFSLLRDRFLPILLHMLLTRVVAGTVWWFLCGFAAVLALLLLALVDHINSGADLPVIVALSCFLGGFLLFSLLSFFSDIIQFFRRTRPRAELQRLQLALNSYENVPRVTILRALGGAISSNVPGESLLASVLTSLMLLGVAGLLIALLLGITFLLPTLGHVPWILFVIIATLLLGFLAPRRIHHFLAARGIN
ncbi:MAG TPA: hypothetical protein VGD98_08140 [Ktedonobacteraceae bacterium]